MSAFAPGDYVKFNGPFGPLGKVLGVDDSLSVVQVEWVFGTDAASGEVISTLASIREEDLVPITERQYMVVRNRRGLERVGK